MNVLKGIKLTKVNYSKYIDILHCSTKMSRDFDCLMSGAVTLLIRQQNKVFYS